MSELWKKTATLLGTSTNATTAYHPQANGLVERMHRTMKASLKAKLGSYPNWCDTLPVVQLGTRAAVKQDINCSVAKMVYGSSCVYLVSFSQPQPAVGTRIPSLSLTCASRCNRCDRFPQCGMANSLAVRLCTQSFPLLVDTHKSPLQAPYKGPFKVLEQYSKYFKLDLGNREVTVSIDRLKPSFIDDDDNNNNNSRNDSFLRGWLPHRRKVQMACNYCFPTRTMF